MIPRYVVLEKIVGETPLAAVDTWRSAHPEYAHVPATYAGRLDPMAEGLLLVLLGDECKRQERYRGLDKEYEVDVLLDISTDTGDALGLPSYAGTQTLPAARLVRTALCAEEGARVVPYPAFSSKTVAGKPLFRHALEGTLDTIQIPTHTERIYRMKHLASDTLSKGALETRVRGILARAPRVPEARKAPGADFRQDAIRAAWSEAFAAMPECSFALLRIRVTCASGAYMRTLAERIGVQLGTHAFALSIRRTRIGRFLKVPGAGLWLKEFI